MALTPIEQIQVAVYVAAAVIGLFAVAFTLWVARPFQPWTKDERSNIAAE